MLYSLPFEANLGQMLFYTSEVELLLEFPELVDVKSLNTVVKNTIVRLGSYFTSPKLFDPDHLLALDFDTLRSLLKRLWNIQNFVNEVHKTYLNPRDPDLVSDFSYLKFHET